jgi:transposase
MSMEGEKSTVEWRELVAQKDEVIKAQGNEIVRLGIEIERLEEENKILIHKRFARSAEQIVADEKQGLLFSEEELKPQGEQKEEDAPDEKTEIQEIKSYKRRKAGRKPINSAIPCVEKIIDIAEDEKTCGCGAKLTKIGEETSEKLIIKPPVIEVEKTIRPKYACRHCEGTEDEGKPTVKIAPLPPCIIPRSIASSSLLAHVITQKVRIPSSLLQAGEAVCRYRC